MSGDVFGNGMLLSRQIRLLAAFDHRHIFIDPDPDAAASFAERARLFALPRSSWDDYDRKLPLARRRHLRARRQVDRAVAAGALAARHREHERATPNEVIRAILRMPVDLLWNGGIGTYVKASEESNGEIGDRANDAVRINGSELRAKVVGEGGNLGLLAARPHRVRARRRPHQHRLHRQLRRRQHLGRRGQPQDHAEPADAARARSRARDATSCWRA